jgi:hypothetical protein
LTEALAKQTSIVVEPIQPDRLPAGRLSSYLAGRGKQALADAATKADAVVTFRSFWPDDPLYAHARRSNIRLVEIDAARPIDGLLPGIAVAEPTDDSPVYEALGLTPMPPSGETTAPWLSPTAIGRMTDILASDLSRLEPSSAQTVNANAADIKRRLLALKADADIALAGADNLTALSLSPHFRYLANDLAVELLGSITAAPAEWTPERCERLSLWLRKTNVPVVLLDTEPSDILQTAILDAKSRYAVLSLMEGRTDDPLAIISLNLKLLVRAFA